MGQRRVARAMVALLRAGLRHTGHGVRVRLESCVPACSLAAAMRALHPALIARPAAGSMCAMLPTMASCTAQFAAVHRSLLPAACWRRLQVRHLDCAGAAPCRGRWLRPCLDPRQSLSHSRSRPEWSDASMTSTACAGLAAFEEVTTADEIGPVTLLGQCRGQRLNRFDGGRGDGGEGGEGDDDGGLQDKSHRPGAARPASPSCVVDLPLVPAAQVWLRSWQRGAGRQEQHDRVAPQAAPDPTADAGVLHAVARVCGLPMHRVRLVATAAPSGTPQSQPQPQPQPRWVRVELLGVQGGNAGTPSGGGGSGGGENSTSALEAAHRLRESWRDVPNAPPLRIVFAGVCECRKLTFADWRGQVRHPASFTIACASDVRQVLRRAAPSVLFAHRSCPPRPRCN